MAGVKRRVFVKSIPYVDADGEGRMGSQGEEVNVHPDDVQHFDWVQNDTPEYRHFLEQQAEAVAEKSARAAKKAPAKDDVPAE